MGGRLIDADKLIELIDDDIASLDKNTSRLIDADQLIEFIDAYITLLNERYKERVSQTAFDVCFCTFQMVKQYIKGLPTVEQKHGRWLPLDKGGDCMYTCSECGFFRDAYILEEKAYCPRCGADMREVEE